MGIKQKGDVQTFFRAVAKLSFSLPESISTSKTHQVCEVLSSAWAGWSKPHCSLCLSS